MLRHYIGNIKIFDTPKCKSKYGIIYLDDLTEVQIMSVRELLEAKEYSCSKSKVVRNSISEFNKY